MPIIKLPDRSCVQSPMVLRMLQSMPTSSVWNEEVIQSSAFSTMFWLQYSEFASANPFLYSILFYSTSTSPLLLNLILRKTRQRPCHASHCHHATLTFAESGELYLNPPCEAKKVGPSFPFLYRKTSMCICGIPDTGSMKS